tara:strand:+ start:38331 stop:38513 length:183 start_codon:yes stop_codon:yes gene_type:complete
MSTIAHKTWSVSINAKCVFQLIAGTKKLLRRDKLNIQMALLLEDQKRFYFTATANNADAD